MASTGTSRYNFRRNSRRVNTTTIAVTPIVDAGTIAQEQMTIMPMSLSKVLPMRTLLRRLSP
uniref:Uncharacterized protein n=1 Tax=Moniliophthora roreri TaxID=221103 RepID=A0A0W0G3L5_MONRR